MSILIDAWFRTLYRKCYKSVVLYKRNNILGILLIFILNARFFLRFICSKFSFSIDTLKNCKGVSTSLIRLNIDGEIYLLFFSIFDWIWEFKEVSEFGGHVEILGSIMRYFLVEGTRSGQDGLQPKGRLSNRMNSDIQFLIPLKLWLLKLNFAVRNYKIVILENCFWLLGCFIGFFEEFYLKLGIAWIDIHLKSKLFIWRKYLLQVQSIIPVLRIDVILILVVQLHFCYVSYCLACR